jgi:hypothetical protein
MLPRGVAAHKLGNDVGVLLAEVQKRCERMRRAYSKTIGAATTI